MYVPLYDKMILRCYDIIHHDSMKSYTVHFLFGYTQDVVLIQHLECTLGQNTP